jgi:hypothetical protein
MDRAIEPTPPALPMHPLSACVSMRSSAACARRYACRRDEAQRGASGYIECRLRALPIKILSEFLCGGGKAVLHNAELLQRVGTGECPIGHLTDF